ncbi:hypothetical protein I4U23_023195 [Adineta vaga]|nr:hypothetical protein I4U23_023195 [Adineta vaga]
MIPQTSERVESATSSCSNKKIYNATIERLSKILQTPSDQRSFAIEDRLKELNKEWDMERLLEFNASTLLVVSIVLGYFHCQCWLLLSFAIAAFLWQHAVQGWCPPVPIFRGIIGQRTSVEILSEKVALKILRGDYQSINPKTFEQEQNAKQLLALADLHCFNDRKSE